jgi:phage shock protein A
MEQKPDILADMNASEAKAYIFNHISTLKLTEKKRDELDRELEKWNSRIELARSKGEEALSLEAEKEAERLKTKRQTLAAEITELKDHIEIMRKQLPGLAARERSVDPDLLEQELLMAAGFLPGDEEKAGTERLFKKLEQEGAADTALEALKAKIGRNGQAGNP